MLLLMGGIKLIPNFDTLENEKAILTSELTIQELMEVYKIDHTVNRDIRYEKVVQLVNYIKQHDSEIGIYIPAIILSYEGSDPENTDYEFLFEKERNFLVLDGQHRIKAIEKYLDKEKDENKVNKILNSKITVQVYFNLTEQEKRQLFIEINGLSKRVSKNISISYDDRNPINTLITDLLKNRRSNPILQMGVEQKKSRLVRPGNINWISMVRLSSFISLLLVGTQEPSKTNEIIIRNQYDEMFSFLQQFFILLKNALPKEPGNVLKNIVGHEAIQNTIALVCHKRIIRKKDNEILFRENWKQTVEMLEYVDWRTNSVTFKDHLIQTQRKNGKLISFADNKHYDLVPLLEAEINNLLN